MSWSSGSSLGEDERTSKSSGCVCPEAQRARVLPRQGLGETAIQALRRVGHEGGGIHEIWIRNKRERKRKERKGKVEKKKVKQKREGSTVKGGELRARARVEDTKDDATNTMQNKNTADIEEARQLNSVLTRRQ